MKIKINFLKYKTDSFYIICISGFFPMIKNVPFYQDF